MEKNLPCRCESFSLLFVKKMNVSTPYQLARKRNVEKMNVLLLNLRNSDCNKSSTSFQRVRKSQLGKKPGLPKRRFSARLHLKVNDEDNLLTNQSQPNYKIGRVHRPNSYGSIKGVKVGTWWLSRLDCNYSGIHRLTGDAIHPGPDGAYSIVLSCEFGDDVDLGDYFTYTGKGERDIKRTAINPKNLRTAPQSAPQILQHGNLVLSRNVETRKPVRVVRGSKLNSKFAPQCGYRYDGLYQVVRYWEAVENTGNRVTKFQFKRCDPEPAPWHMPSSRIPENSFHADDGIQLTPAQEVCFVTERATNFPDNSSRKIMYFELSPGRKIPIKVGYFDGTLKDCSVVIPRLDLGWHGWENVCVVPGSDFLTFECEGRTVRACVTGDKWHRVVRDLVKCCTSPVQQTSSQDNVDPQNICMNQKEHVCTSLEDCCKDSDTIPQGVKDVPYHPNMYILGIEYQGCIVHVCWKDNKFQEITPSMHCDENVDTNYDWSGWP